MTAKRVLSAVLLVFAAAVFLNCLGVGEQPGVSLSPRPLSPSATVEQCLTPEELRTGLMTNWELGVRPGAEVIEESDGRPAVLVHPADGSDYKLTYREFVRSSKAAFRECRKDSSQD